MRSSGTEFGLNHLPYGVFSTKGDQQGHRLGVAIGDQIADLASLASAGLLDDPTGALSSSTLNRFMTEGPSRWAEVRAQLTALLADTSKLGAHLVAQSSARMHLAWDVADYVDFYSSLDHATNVGKMFRPDADALLPNWKHLPVGYHGRAGTVVVSGTDIVRPSGQRKGPNDPMPVFGASARLDIEAEVGFVVGVPSQQGSPVPTTAFADHVFGVVLVNDWSARDIQAWEYQPLGPFLGKSFATSVSAWVTPLAALAGARCSPPAQDPAVLPYLVDADPWSLDLRLSVELNGEEVSAPPFSTMYWTPGQQLAHMTINGASLRTGDLFASGTVSGPTKHERGSFLELSWGGTEPLTFADGSTRTFLLDGDQITISALAQTANGEPIHLGPVSGVIQSTY
jgi:fumarylacetoacetase